MGVKAEGRFIALSRRHFDEQNEASRRDPWKLIRNQDAIIRERDETIAELRSKIAALEHDIERAKRCIRSVELSRSVERQDRKEEREKTHDRYMSVVKDMFRFKRSWEKLSKIVRIGMTPEQYHSARLELPGEVP